jgi:copper transport protein
MSARLARAPLRRAPLARAPLPVRGLRTGLTTITLLMLALALPAAASAHAVLVASTPEWGAVTSSEPHQLRLVYDEDVVPRYARVSVLMGHSANLAGKPQVLGRVVIVALRAAPRGSYTIRWKMVAADDGHVTEGAYSFGVNAKPLPPPPISGLSVPVAPQLLAWLQFLAIALAGGMLTLRALVWAPAAKRLGREQAPDAKLAIGVGVVGAAVGLHAGLFGFLVGAYPIVGGGVSSFINTLIEPIRTGTHLGQAFTVMTFTWLVVLGLLVAAWVTPKEREPLLAGAGVLALAIAFDLAWASHPASRGTLALIVDFIHLLAAALWAGGLVAVLILAIAARPLAGSAREALTRSCVLRFSKLALPVVAVVGAAGIYLAVRELPAPADLLSSGYGVTLLLKTGVALGALSLGAYHRRFVMPRLNAGQPVASIRRTLTLELGFLLAVLVLAAVLTQSAPP